MSMHSTKYYQFRHKCHNIKKGLDIQLKLYCIKKQTLFRQYTLVSVILIKIAFLLLTCILIHSPHDNAYTSYHFHKDKVRSDLLFLISLAAFSPFHLSQHW